MHAPHSVYNVLTVGTYPMKIQQKHAGAELGNMASFNGTWEVDGIVGQKHKQQNLF